MNSKEATTVMSSYVSNNEKIHIITMTIQTEFRYVSLLIFAIKLSTSTITALLLPT